MNNARIWGIIFLIGYCIFLFRDDLRSFSPIPGTPIPQEIKDLGDKVFPIITKENKKDVISIGNLLIHESALFTMDKERYPSDRELKDKYHETLSVSAGYPYGIDISKYPSLKQFLIDYSVSSIGEEEFTNQTISNEFKKLGEALKYAACK